MCDYLKGNSLKLSLKTSTCDRQAMSNASSWKHFWGRLGPKSYQSINCPASELLHLMNFESQKGGSLSIISLEHKATQVPRGQRIIWSRSPEVALLPQHLLSLKFPPFSYFIGAIVVPCSQVRYNVLSTYCMAGKDKGRPCPFKLTTSWEKKDTSKKTNSNRK